MRVPFRLKGQDVALYMQRFAMTKYIDVVIEADEYIDACKIFERLDDCASYTKFIETAATHIDDELEELSVEEAWPWHDKVSLTADQIEDMLEEG